jgi:CheY-like chemotaxis protein
MKVNITCQDTTGMAFRTVLNGVFEILKTGDVIHPDTATADVVLCMTKSELVPLYNEQQLFLLIAVGPQGNLPRNVVDFPLFGNWLDLTIAQLNLWRIQSQKNPQREVSVFVKTGEENVPQDTSSALRILVIDDKPNNLALALTLLGGRHYVTLASGYGEGLGLIDTKKYDVVLCDCQMPVHSDASSSLATRAIELAPVPCGPLLMFHATKKGAHFAIVTAANHHLDWTASLFGSLREPQTVNGKTVLFIGDERKKWDRALEKLLASV